MVWRNPSSMPTEQGTWFTAALTVVAYDEEEARDLAHTPGWGITGIEERIR